MKRVTVLNQALVALLCLSCPYYPAALNNKGTVLRDEGNYTGAIGYYDKALAIEPNLLSALNNKGIDISLMGKRTGGISYFFGSESQ
jgi:tetratricopeptide (TPR) repeat protein